MASSGTRPASTTDRDGITTSTEDECGMIYQESLVSFLFLDPYVHST